MRFFRISIITVGLVLVFTASAWADIGYTLKDGETLEQVAAKFKIQVTEILEANNIEDASSVEPGTRLVIPIGPEAENIFEKPSWGYIEHIVQSGDSLYGIAKKYRCTVDTLAEFNKIKRDKTLQIGEVIKVPIKDKKAKESTGKAQVLFDLSSSDDETPASEASKTDESEPGMTVNIKAENVKGKNLLDLSELDGAVVEIKGSSEKQETKIPDKTQTGKSTNKEDTKQSRPKYIMHVVEKGDSISRISKIYGVSQKSIMQENKISEKTTLQIGRQLKVPNPALKDNSSSERDDGLISRNLTKRDKIVRYALEHVGLRYRYSGSNLDYGVDCSGFTMEVFERFGISLPHSSADQSRVGREVERNNLLPGDLLFFRTTSKSISHVGIYIGDGKFVHSTRTGQGVIVSPLSDEYYAKRYVCARRVL